MKLPEITALQFVTLSLLFSGEKTARQLRRQLQKWGGPRTSSAFSQLVGRLQRAAYIDAVRENRAAQRFSQTRYRLTDLGLIVWQLTRRFYASFDAPPPNFKPVPTDEAQFARLAYILSIVRHQLPHVRVTVERDGQPTVIAPHAFEIPPIARRQRMPRKLLQRRDLRRRGAFDPLRKTRLQRCDVLENVWHGGPV